MHTHLYECTFIYINCCYIDKISSKKQKPRANDKNCARPNVPRKKDKNFQIKFTTQKPEKTTHTSKQPCRECYRVVVRIQLAYILQLTSSSFILKLAIA